MKYRTFSEEMKERFGGKVYKLALSSGCSCPNRDGRLGYGGCSFCSEGGSGEFASPFLPLPEQLQRAKLRVDGKLPAGIPAEERRYIAYFQSYSNTYGDPERLRTLYSEVLEYPEIVAMSLGTRPDCLDEEILDMLSELNQRKPVWVELGLQTIHEKTAESFGRGYPLSVFEESYRKLKERGLEVVVHMILGLPEESREEMLESIRYLASLEPALDGIKLQLLHVLKGSRLAEEYRKKPFPLLTLEEYCELAGDCLRLLPEETVVHRITGDGPKALLLAPLWSADKKRVLNTLHRWIKELP